MGKTQHPPFQTTGIQNGESLSIPLVVHNTHIDHIPHRFRLILFKSGNGVVEIGLKQLHFIAPAILCLPNGLEPCTVISTQPVETREIVFHPLLINPDYEQLDPELLWIQAFVKRNDHYQGLIFIDSLTAQRIDALMNTLDDELKHPHDNYWVCRSKSYLIECLLIVDRLTPQVNNTIPMPFDNTLTVFDHLIQEGTTYDPLVSQLLTYLHLHYHEQITIDQLSHHFNLNRTTLNSKFKTATNKTIAQYLIDFRIHISKMLLTLTQLQVAEIIDRIGFRDLAHFSRSFKQRTGMTPIAYRRTFAK